MCGWPMKQSSGIRLSKKTVLWLSVALAFLACSGILLFLTDRMKKRLYDQQAVRTWTEDGKGASQLTVFYPVDDRAGIGRIREMEYGIRETLIKDAVYDPDEYEDRLPYVSCLSVPGTVRITSGSLTVEANAIGTGGDFFRFHPVTLLTGSYYSQELETPDRILLDEDLAWQLFGSYDVIGMTVTIGGVTHTVSGVFDIPSVNSIEREAGIPQNLVFLSAESLCQLGVVGGRILPDQEAGEGSGTKQAQDTSGAGAAIGTAPVIGINAYEIILPDPVRNYALQLLTDKAQVKKGRAYVLENSSRFRGEALLANFKGFFSRGMQVKPLIYPYWENIARGYTNLFSLLFAAALACLAAGLLIPCILLYRVWRRRTWTVAGEWARFSDWRYEQASKRKMKKEQQIEVRDEMDGIEDIEDDEEFDKDEEETGEDGEDDGYDENETREEDIEEKEADEDGDSVQEEETEADVDEEEETEEDEEDEDSEENDEK